MGITNTPPSATLCGILSKSSGPITIMMKMIIVALCVAAAVAMPIQDEESLEVSVEQTQEFGIIKKAWNHVFKKDVSEADVSCKMENCGGCETKYRTGRRLLEADDEELFAEQKWGIFSRRRRAPPKIAYMDCTKRDACLVKNAGCKAKIDQLKVAHEALKKDLASGMLLVTGPYGINGVPLRRVNRAYVIATKTKLDISGVTVDGKFNDAYFRRPVKVAKKKTEDEFFASEESKPELSAERKEDQKKVDSALLAIVKKTDSMKAYLNARFSLTNGMAPHELVF